jgi:hypothetical protein
MKLSLDVKIGGSLWSAAALTPLSHSSICRRIEEWESGVKAAALQSFALVHAKLNIIGLKAGLQTSVH